MIKKLLAATSVAALIVGGANAQLALEQANVAGDDISAPIVVAEEIDFAALAGETEGTALFGLEVLTEGTIPPGQNLFLTINITNGTLASNLDGSEFGGTSAPAAGGVTGAVVNDGGLVGDNFVRYLLTSDALDSSLNGGGRDGAALFLPVIMDACGDVTFRVTEFATESGATPIEGGSAVLTDGSGDPVAAVTCENVYQASLVPDLTNTVLSLASSFEDFDVAAPDTAAIARLGLFDFEVDTAAYRDLGFNFADPSDVLGFAANVNFEDDTNIVEGEATPTAGTLFVDGPVAITGTTILLESAISPTLANETGEFLLTIANTDPTVAQNVSVSGAALALDDALFLQASDAFVEADVEDLKYEGNIFGPFDWVSDSTKAVNSIFRITGLATDEDVPAQIVVENSRNGAAFNGVYPFTILGSSVQGSEVRVNSAQLEAIVGQFGTADISMVFSVNRDLDVDRLNASPSSSVVTPFGDNANSDGSTDLLTSPGTGVNNDEGNY